MKTETRAPTPTIVGAPTIPAPAPVTTSEPPKPRVPPIAPSSVMMPPVPPLGLMFGRELAQPTFLSELAPIDPPPAKDVEVKRTLLEVLPRALSVELATSVSDRGFQRFDTRLGLDLGRLRDEVTPLLRRETRDLGTFAVDLAVAQAWDVVGGITEHLVMKALGKDVTYKGLNRFLEDTKQHGLFNLRWESLEWKDGNYGSTINTLHGVPFNLASGYFRARGYEPGVALLAGVVTNILVHETIFERWEQPKSIYDMFFMNTLGAIFGSFPGLGMEITMNPLNGNPASTFYGKDSAGNRYSVTFEQTRDYFAEGVPVADRPVIPWDIILGTHVRAADGLDVGVTVRLVANQTEKHDPLRGIHAVELGASLRYRLP
ncbi:hypothetical protein L6R52_37435 [Myxococcota bacterium]|nr:hypothetical protein [Myxococcota bacterium]